jgi:hypothetical protein
MMTDEEYYATLRVVIKGLVYEGFDAPYNLNPYNLPGNYFSKPAEIRQFMREQYFFVPDNDYANLTLH